MIEFNKALLSNIKSVSKSEFAVAEALAGDGKKVKLLSESAPARVKTPDAEIIGEGIFDFKNVKAISENSIKTNVRDYVMNPFKRNEADGLVFYIKDNPSATPASINQGVLDAVSTVSNESNLAKKIGVPLSPQKMTTKGLKFFLSPFFIYIEIVDVLVRGNSGNTQF